MNLSTKLAAGLLGGLLFAVTSGPVWAGSASAPAQANVPAATEASPVSVMNPLLAMPAEPRVTPRHCKADTLYSTHDVIGDPDACIMNKVDVRGNALSTGAVGIL